MKQTLVVAVVFLSTVISARAQGWALTNSNSTESFTVLSGSATVGIGVATTPWSIEASGTSNPAFVLSLSGVPMFYIGLPTADSNFIKGSVANTDVAFRANGGKILFSTSPTGFTNDLTLKEGKVGIGTRDPAAPLDVNGNVHVTGDITMTGNINAKFQDVAEWVPVTEEIPAGTVVVVSGTTRNTVVPSQNAYDTRVAGVVSARPGVILGEASSTKAKIATTGRVRVHVDATSHPIAMGDLLVTSGRLGMAMKSEPLDLGGVKIHRPGTLIGKALEPLAGGEGEILVLLSLQ